MPRKTQEERMMKISECSNLDFSFLLLQGLSRASREVASKQLNCGPRAKEALVAPHQEMTRTNIFISYLYQGQERVATFLLKRIQSEKNRNGIRNAFHSVLSKCLIDVLDLVN